MEEAVIVRVEFTGQQQKVLNGLELTSVRVVDPRTGNLYVLIPAGDFEDVREIIEDERRRRAIGAVAVQDAAGRVAAAP